MTVDEEIKAKLRNFQEWLTEDYMIFPYIHGTELLLYSVQLTFIFKYHFDQFKSSWSLIAQFIIFELMFIGSLVNSIIFCLRM